LLEAEPCSINFQGRGFEDRYPIEDQQSRMHPLLNLPLLPSLNLTSTLGFNINHPNLEFSTAAVTRGSGVN